MAIKGEYQSFASMLDSQANSASISFALKKTIGLDELPNGCGGEIRAVQGNGRAARELLTLGLVPGVRVQVLRRGLGGDPLEIFAGGHPVCLRRDQTRKIRVLPANGKP